MNGSTEHQASTRLPASPAPAALGVSAEPVAQVTSFEDRLLDMFVSAVESEDFHTWVTDQQARTAA